MQKLVWPFYFGPARIGKKRVGGSRATIPLNIVFTSTLKHFFRQNRLPVEQTLMPVKYSFFNSFLCAFLIFNIFKVLWNGLHPAQGHRRLEATGSHAGCCQKGREVSLFNYYSDFCFMLILYASHHIGNMKKKSMIA